MFLINVKAHYDSAHFLRNYHGKCERLHGHRYVVEAAFRFGDEAVDRVGMAFDFAIAKKHLRAIADELDHRNINDIPPFTEIEPSAENQARFIHERLADTIPEYSDNLYYVRVWETPNQWAQYSRSVPAEF